MRVWCLAGRVWGEGGGGVRLEGFWRPCAAETWRRASVGAGAAAVAARVSELLAALRGGGDVGLARIEAALREDAAAAVDRALAAPPLAPTLLEVPAAALAAAWDAAPAELRAALQTARTRLRDVLAPAVPRPHTHQDGGGNLAQLRPVPLERVGVYVPGGRAAYPSSVLMCVVPARLAGVGTVVLCTPAGPNGEADPAVLAAAAVAGVDRVFRLGAVPALAAMAFGLGPVPACDKVVGPGNPYVVEAKRQLYGTVGLDGLPGPSEIVVLATAGADPAWVASDLLAQAEHGPDGLSLLVTDDAALADAVGACLAGRLAELPPQRAQDAAAALRASGGPVLAPTPAAGLAFAERVAPEHLSLQGRDAESLAPAVRRAGALFVGPWSPVAGGDYAAGTDHVLPTAGAARYASALGPADFVRTLQVFQGSASGCRLWAPAAAALARAEGFAAHAASIEARLAAAPAQGPASGRVAAPYVPPVPAGAVRMDLNENPFPWSESLWRDVLSELQSAEPTRYPRATDRLQAALAEYAGVVPSRCLPANGSDELLLAAVAAWGRRVRRVLFPAPTFGMYRRLAEAAGLEAVAVPTGPAPGFALPVERLLAEVAKGGETLLFLCRPNNPTGGLWPKEAVRRLVEAEGVWAVVDEAYVEFAGPDAGLTAWIDRYPRLCLLRTMSKAFGLAGLRVGYALCGEQGLEPLRAAVQPWAVSSFSCVAALSALGRRDEMTQTVAALVAERERLAGALGRMEGFTPYPSHSNYILFHVDARQTGWQAQDLFDALYREGAVLRRFASEPALTDCLRVSVGQPQENDRLLTLLYAARTARARA